MALCPTTTNQTTYPSVEIPCWLIWGSISMWTIYLHITICAFFSATCKTFQQFLITLQIKVKEIKKRAITHSWFGRNVCNSPMLQCWPLLLHYLCLALKHNHSLCFLFGCWCFATSNLCWQWSTKPVTHFEFEQNNNLKYQIQIVAPNYSSTTIHTT